MKFLPYEPDQAWLLPPRVKDVLGEDHLCFFIHQVVERLDLSAFAAQYREEGQRPYAPALMVKVWLYAYCLQVTSSRRLEQRLKEDLAFRYLAGGAGPDHWTLNAKATRTHPGGRLGAIPAGLPLPWGAVDARLNEQTAATTRLVRRLRLRAGLRLGRR